MTGRPAFAPVKPREIGTPKACVAELYEQHGGVKRVMVKLDRGKSVVYGYADPQSPEQLTFAQAVQLTDRTATAVVEYLALISGGVYLPITPEDGDIPTLCADDVRAHGDAVASVVTAMADDLAEPDAKAALEKIDAALRALVGLRSVVVVAANPKPETLQKT